jgi:hypothetical protein
MHSVRTFSHEAPPARRFAGWAALALAATPALGCHPGLPDCTVVQEVKQEKPIEPEYVVVERTVAQASGLPPKAEITATPTYAARHASLTKVALRLPDNCFQGKAQLGTGTNTTTALLESACGVPLQVLERSLTREKYQVLSWAALMGIEREQRVPVHKAAQLLGADFVVVLNVVDVGVRDAGAEAAVKYHYYASNPNGERLGAKKLFNADRAFFKDYVHKRAGDDAKAQAGSSMQGELNATAVLSETGEAIWFYNWRVGQASSTSQGVQFLFAGIPSREYEHAFRAPNPSPNANDADAHYWWPVAPPSSAAAPTVVADRAESEEGTSTRVEVSRHEEEALYRLIADDFIRQFKCGGPQPC